MYGGYSTWILLYGRPNSDVTFWTPILNAFSLKTHFRHFPTREALLFLEI